MKPYKYPGGFAMYELIQLSPRDYYIQSPAKIGLVRLEGNDVCLIDSGNDKDAGKKVKKILDANSWTLGAIFNTHSHADHIGGNQYLQKQTGCRIYAPGIERDFTEHPILEPAFLYGANPPGELRHKFLMAQGCDVMPLTDSCLPAGITPVSLPGHSWDMAGFRTTDDVVFLADCLSSRETLEKYQISFLVDVQAYLSTLDMVSDMQARLFIPSHAEATEDISALAQFNKAKVMEIADAIVDLCARPRSFESLLSELFTRFNLKMTFEQHALVGSTVRSYLTWLKEQHRLEAVIEDNAILWKA